jgi:hypothetical protein
MEDQKYMDELIEKRAAARAVEQADRGAAAGAAVSPGGSAEKVGPAPTKGSRGPLTREQFDRLSLEEKRAALADVRI